MNAFAPHVPVLEPALAFVSCFLFLLLLFVSRRSRKFKTFNSPPHFSELKGQYVPVSVFLGSPFFSLAKYYT